MSRKLTKYFVVLSMLCVSIFTVIFDVEAKDGDFNVVGKVYTFIDDEYKISKSKEFISTNEDVDTYGKFSINRELK